ncbi:hypothetical protein SHI21_06030 [Bacteriovorax sp. PP10]|uniref:DUF4157 domain-containing protein n=1 Tax=Bacteriovorax antarcticus TaxID=3088717 RepID=A0ABU5VRS4_9BACT|nr:hypothetical protein [Bacteriovorax sp. PP10]MEA9355747.1 hypothetical protein [Bacteriovorax sp. PP10]
MKKLAILLLSQMLCFQAFAWRESNGGNGIEAEAKAIASQIVKDLWRVPVLRKYYIASEYNIVQQQGLRLKTDQEIGAYTVSDSKGGVNMIFVNSAEDQWPKLSFAQKRYLLLHELTHVMFFKDSQYDFSQIALDKMEKYDKLVAKYPDSEYPIETEIVNSVNSCKLTTFVTTYLLIGDLQYVMETTNKTIQQLILESSCDSIKNYAPLKAQMTF